MTGKRALARLADAQRGVRDSNRATRRNCLTTQELREAPAFIRILMDQGIYVSMMIFAAGFRHLVRRARPESDWLGLLALVSAAVWLAVTLAADGLMGGAVLATLQGTSDVSAALPLVFGTLLIYNGSIAFAITGLFMMALPRVVVFSY